MAILNYTTTIAPAKSVGEIQSILARHGATRIMVEYGADGPSGLSFVVIVDGSPAAFRLPAKIDGVLSALKRQAGKGRITRSMCTREHASRVAWRILKDWVEAQLALVEAELVTVDEVMLPYLLGADGDRTMYQVIRERRMQLPPPGSEG